MPWAIKKRGSKWVIIKETDGTVKGTHDSEDKAKKQLRLLQGIEHGWTPKKKK